MNYHMIRYILGQIMKLEAALMGLPLLVSLYYLDEGMIPLLSVMLPLGILEAQKSEYLCPRGICDSCLRVDTAFGFRRAAVCY